jgi:hypothetical protein
VPPVNSGEDAESFFVRCMSKHKFDDVINYVRLVREGKVSLDRFAPILETSLP